MDIVYVYGQDWVEYLTQEQRLFECKIAEARAVEHFLADIPSDMRRAYER